MMTLTTTGHVDIIRQDMGATWEIMAAVGTCFVATFVYIYVNASTCSGRHARLCGPARQVQELPADPELRG